VAPDTCVVANAPATRRVYKLFRSSLEVNADSLAVIGAPCGAKA
jgi:hypothetical protein